MLHPKNLVGYSFIIKGKVEEKKFFVFFQYMSCFHHQFLPLLYGQTRTLIAFGKNIFRSQYNKGF